MKKQLLTLLLLAAVTSGFAQNNFRSLISNDHGLTAHFTRLDQTELVVFESSKLHSILGLDDNSDLVLIGTETDQIGGVHYRYQQTYQGIPVENSMYIIHTKNGLITGMSGSIVMDFDSKMSSRSALGLQNPKAIANAVKHVNASKYMWQDPAMEQRIKVLMNDQQASYYPKANLVWYNAGEEINPRDLRLAYKVDVYAQQPVSRSDIFVDAQTGKILGEKCRLLSIDATGIANTAYSGSQTIHSDLSGGIYNLNDYSKGNGILTLKVNGNDFTSPTSSWTLSAPDKYALDAHYGIAATYTYYLDNFNRNSLDNAGALLVSYVNDPNYTNNAVWDGLTITFGNFLNGAGTAGIDVAGHEVTHGVTQHTCALNVSYQSGAINESLSDIMGKSVQFYTKPADVNWLISNDISWSLRSMSDPNLYQCPDTYLGTYWSNSGSDLGGVHRNSSVGNFMFYLLVTGGSGTNDIGNAYAVTGIGLAEADQIIYRTQTVYLTSTSQYVDWRTACINAAIDLYGFSSNEVIQVENAWYAVGIGTSGSGGPCGTPGGLNATSITSSAASLNWSSISGATSYNVQYRMVGNATWSSTISSTTTKAVSGLGVSTQYEFQVQAVCSGGTSAFSGSTIFTTLSCTNSNEPNNSSSSATPVSVGIDISSQLGSSTDKDWFSFSNNSSSHNIKVTLGTLPGNYDIKLYKPNGSIAVTSQNSGTTSEIMIYNTSTVGTYKIKVYGNGGAFSTTQCYTMHIYTGNLLFRLNNESVLNTDANSLIKLYPNPASNQMTIQYNGEEGIDATLRITNALGQIVSVSQQHLESGSAMTWISENYTMANISSA